MTACIGTSILAGCSAARKPEGAATPAAPAAARTEQPVAEAPAAVSPDRQSIGWTATPLAVRSEPVAVKEGSAPLVYLVETPGAFRVHDQTTGQDLAGGHAAGRSILRVDGRSGVVFGGETLVPGPLDRDHHYVIYRDPTGPNMARQGTFQLVPPPRAKGPSQQLPSQESSRQLPKQALQDPGGREHEGGTHVDR